MNAPDESPTPAHVDLSKPSTARMYNYYLGGKDNYPVDREAARKVIEAATASGGDVCAAARENLRFAGRATAWAVAEFGIDQVLDIGMGIVHGIPLPTVEQAVHQVNPDAVVVGLDHDPIVLQHSAALRHNHEDPRHGYAAVLYGDVRELEGIFTNPHLNTWVDLSRPVVVDLVAVMHFIPEAEGPAELMAELCDRVPDGSLLVFSHICSADTAPDALQSMESGYDNASSPAIFRTLSQLHDDLLVGAGWEPCTPLLDVQRWAPPGQTYEGEDTGTLHLVGTVARKRSAR